jgi:hypothetical protein
MMSSRWEKQMRDQRQEDEAWLLEAVVRDGVLSELGQPADPHHVQVRQVSGRSYRVNVFAGDDASAKITHSYFLTADCNGKILTSDPALDRLY